MTYPQLVRDTAVKLAVVTGTTATADTLDIPAGTIRRWVNSVQDSAEMRAFVQEKQAEAALTISDALESAGSEVMQAIKDRDPQVQRMAIAYGIMLERSRLMSGQDAAQGGRFGTEATHTPDHPRLVNLVQLQQQDTSSTQDTHASAHEGDA